MAESQKPQNIAAQIIVTAFTDGRPMSIVCTCDPLNAILLLTAALADAARESQKQTIPVHGQADPVDKERKFLGPREEVEEKSDAL